MNSTQIDYGIVAVCIFLASHMFGPEVAGFVGPYIVIVLASSIGASFSLARRETTTKALAFAFFLRINGLAILLTVGLAGMANSYRPEWSGEALLAPIAFTVGFVGDDWPKVMLTIYRKLNALVDVLIKLKGGGNG